MTQQDYRHPITPPPELVQQWATISPLNFDDENWGYELFIAHHAAQWGADQELEACCEYLVRCAQWEPEDVEELRAVRRPKPKLASLKEQALALIDSCNDPDNDYLDDNSLAIIRRALEQLDD
jgi:hypothetical protein